MRAEAKVRKGGIVDTADSSASSLQPPRNRIRIAEIYASLQGEGLWTGSPSVFLRTSGCNLRCHFCDTPFTSWQPEGNWMSVEQLVARVLEFAETDVVITGGEPLLVPDLAEICRQLTTAQRRITIETAGTLDQSFQCDLLSISPKLASSAPDAVAHPAWHTAHNARRQRIDLVRRWFGQYNVQLKFVVATDEDTAEVLRYLDALEVAATDQVWIMPEGVTTDILDQRAEWLQPWCDAHGFHFCQRQHIYWYGNRRGT